MSASLSGTGVAASYPVCPAEQQFTPVTKWYWTGAGAVQPSVNSVAMTPLVVNLTDTNGDGLINENDIPNVVFTACSAGNCCYDCQGNPADADFLGLGMLRAISGETGTSAWDVTDSSLQLGAVTQLATADLDGDNLPEIVAVKHTFTPGSGMQGLYGKYVSGVLLVFDHTGQLEFETDAWTGDPNSLELLGAPAIADL